MPERDERIQECIMSMLEEREGSLCPSAIARELDDDWRDRLDAVHEVAHRMAREGRIEIRQAGERIDPDERSGPYRIGARS